MRGQGLLFWGTVNFELMSKFLSGTVPEKLKLNYISPLILSFTIMGVPSELVFGED